MEQTSAQKRRAPLKEEELTLSSILMTVLMVVVMLLFVSIVTMTAWNYSIPQFSSLGQINLTQALALLVLVRVLSGMMSCGNTVLLMAA